MIRTPIASLPTAFFAAILCLFFQAETRAQNHFGTATVNASIGAAINATSIDTLQKFVKQLSGVLPVTLNGQPVYTVHRYAGNGSLEFQQSAQFIYNTFHRYGLNPVIENNASPWTKINVYGTIPGRRSEYVVVCGHFDSANQNCPGADDNASGTAAVMEAARILRNYNFEYSIRLIAFGGEEQGMKGSALYMTQHAADSIRAALNCDMIMWDGDSDKVVQLHAKVNNPPTYSDDLAMSVAAIDSLYSVGMNCQKIIPGITASDHASFWNASRSAVLLIEEYGSDFNPYYHGANDNWAILAAQKHQDYFKGVGKLTVGSAAWIAQVTGPVPVTFAALTASSRGGRVTIEWTTASETNNVGFEIERRGEYEQGWSARGFVQGSGTTNTTRSYSFDDRAGADGHYTYRLKQIDSDGTVNYSPGIDVDVAASTAFDLAQNYPNPFGSSTRIPYTLASESAVRIAVYDMLGREVAVPVNETKAAGRHSVSFRGDGLAPGVYNCRLEIPGNSKTIRMIVAR
jgi:hypothetical protein